MKKIFWVTVLIFISSINSFSQDKESKWAFELSTGKNEYRGDRANTFFSGGVNYTGFSGIGVNKDFIEFGATRYLNSDFDANIQLSSGKYGAYKHEFNQFSGRKNDLTIAIRYKINNGYLLSENAFISPFFSAGVGAATYSGYESSVPMSYLLTFGVGLNIRISAAISLQYHLGYNFNTDDKADRKTANDTPPKLNNDYLDGKGDNFLKQTFGIVVNFGNFGKSGRNGGSSIFDIRPNRGRLFTKK